MKIISRKSLAMCLVSLMILMSCDKNVIGDFETELVSIDPDPTVITGKKGVAFTNNKRAWSHKTSAMQAHWMYSWGNELRDEIPENVEFVPMFWGRNSVSDANINRIKDLVAEGKVKYILGFNEPDGVSQANMTVDEAIELWPRLEEIGVPIGSPATVNATNDWMQEFMQRAKEEGLRVDFVALHHYGGANPATFISKLREAHNLYDNLPIWVTEFAVADWSASLPENNRYSEAEVISFMQESLQALEDIDWVHRYSWFDGQNAPLYTSGLFDEDDNLTSLGSVYAQNTPNAIIGPGQDTEFNPTDPTMISQDHETAEVGDAGGSLGYQLGGGSSTIEVGTGSGNTTKVLKVTHNNGVANLYVRTQQVEVEEGDVYTFTYDISTTSAVHTLKLRLSNGDVGPFTVISPDNVTTTNGTPDTGNIGKINGATPDLFGTVTATFTIPAGFNSARFQIYQWGATNSLELDNLSALK